MRCSISGIGEICDDELEVTSTTMSQCAKKIQLICSTVEISGDITYTFETLCLLLPFSNYCILATKNDNFL